MAVEKSDIMVVRYFREARVFTRRLCKPPPQPHTCGRSLTDTDRPSFCRRSLQNDPRLHELGDQEVAMAAAATLSDIKDLKDAAYFRRQAERTTAIAQTILQPDVRKTLSNLARAYEELADDLDQGPVRLRHPELLPQRVL